MLKKSLKAPNPSGTMSQPLILTQSYTICTADYARTKALSKIGYKTYLTISTLNK